MANPGERPVATRRRWLGVSAAILALLVAGGVVAGSQLISPGRGHAQLSGNLDARVVYAERAGAHRYQLFVLEHPGATARAVGTAETFSVVRFSPDARTLAALAPAPGPGESAVLLLIGTTSSRIELPGESLASAIAWSPDSDLLAVVGATTYVIDRRGAVVGTYEAGAASPDGRAHMVVSGGYEWAPAGEAFVALVNGTLVVMRPSVPPAATDVGELLPGATSVFIDGWLDGVGPVLAGNGVRTAVSIAGDPAPMPLEGGETVLAPAGLRGLSAEVRVRAESRVSGGVLLWMRPTADGNGVVAEVRGGDGAGTIVTFPLAGEPSESRVTGFDLDTTHGGGLVDAVLLR